jgi:hypothetical protein
MARPDRLLQLVNEGEWPVLCCAVLCCAVLCCAVLCCAVLAQQKRRMSCAGSTAGSWNV